MRQMTEDQQKRYNAAAHGVQAGTKLTNLTPTALDCRIGLNVTMTEFAHMCELLVNKGIITEDELYETMITANLNEKARMERELSGKNGGKVKITLV